MNHEEELKHEITSLLSQVLDAQVALELVRSERDELRERAANWPRERDLAIAEAFRDLLRERDELRKEVAGLKRPLPPSGGLCMACAGPVDESGATTAHDVADQGPAERENTDWCVATIARLAAERDEAHAEVEHQKLRGARLAERVDRAMAERDDARALVLEMFRIACATNNSYLRAVEGKPWRYDHQCTETYEDAQAKLIAWGLVKREECVRP